MSQTAIIEKIQKQFSKTKERRSGYKYIGCFSHQDDPRKPDNIDQVEWLGGTPENPMTLETGLSIAYENKKQYLGFVGGYGAWISNILPAGEKSNNPDIHCKETCLIRHSEINDICKEDQDCVDGSVCLNGICKQRCGDEPNQDQQKRDLDGMCLSLDGKSLGPVHDQCGSPLDAETIYSSVYELTNLKIDQKIKETALENQLKAIGRRENQINQTKQKIIEKRMEDQFGPSWKSRVEQFNEEEWNDQASQQYDQLTRKLEEMEILRNAMDDRINSRKQIVHLEKERLREIEDSVGKLERKYGLVKDRQSKEIILEKYLNISSRVMIIVVVLTILLGAIIISILRNETFKYAV